MNKTTPLLLSTLLLITTFGFYPTQTQALSCMESYPYIGQIQEPYRDPLLLSGSPYENFNILNAVRKDENRTVNSATQHKNILSAFLTQNPTHGTTIGAIAGGPAATESLPVVADIQTGDYIVASGDKSQFACSNNSLITIFDKDSKKLKAVIHRGVPAGNYGAEEHFIIVKDIIQDSNNNVGGIFEINGQERVLHPRNKVDLTSNSDEAVHITAADMGGFWDSQPSVSFFVDIDPNAPEPDSNSNTDDLCFINYSRLIRFGVRGNDVAQTQQCLNNLGYNTGVVDGIYGNNTYRGITAFQVSQNIKVDGIVGPQTVSYLNNF